jgi:hypothetical protein
LNVRHFGNNRSEEYQIGNSPTIRQNFAALNRDHSDVAVSVHGRLNEHNAHQSGSVFNPSTPETSAIAA